MFHHGLIALLEGPLNPGFGLSGMFTSHRLGLAAVRFSILLGRSLRNKSSKDVAFPHPQSRKDHYRKEDKPSGGGVIWTFFKRTITMTESRNA